MDYDAVANNVIMNQLCKVCGEPAAGFHFGAFTCEGCKSFFGRTYNNIGSISECKNNGECVINKKNRTACKACRLRKCLLVGMSKSGSRYGRRSNWFKIHCLLQEQQQSGAGMAAAAGLLRPHPYLSPLFRNPSATTTTTTTSGGGGGGGKSSESDSGASSADPEDEIRSSSALSYLKPSPSPSSERDYYAPHVTGKRPAAASPRSSDGDNASSRKRRGGGGGVAIVPRWMPPAQGVADPWREFWTTRAPPTPVAAPAPDQDEPIDLSLKTRVVASSPSPTTAAADDSGEESDRELNIDVGVEEPLKSVPLDLTLDRQLADVGH